MGENSFLFDKSKEFSPTRFIAQISDLTDEVRKADLQTDGLQPSPFRKENQSPQRMRWGKIITYSFCTVAVVATAQRGMFFYSHVPL